MGGKFRMAPRLVELLPDHICYVETFAGAANLLFTKAPSKTEVINDVNAELVNLFRVIKFHKREFILQLADILHSRLCFLDYKAQPGLTDIQRAAQILVTAQLAEANLTVQHLLIFAVVINVLTVFMSSALTFAI